MEELANLPEEIIVLILCYLPVKSLVRFTCVSKGFHSMILSDPKFAKSQLQAARDRKTLTRRFLYAGYYGVESVDLDTPSFGDCSADFRKLKFPSEPQPAAGDVKLLGSCNGIVFLFYDALVFTAFYMWNPCTGFSKKLPDPDPELGDHKMIDMFWGVGYLPAIDDYRIFVVYSVCDDDDTMGEAAVFSLRANAWKTVGCIELDWNYTQATLWKETLHWLIYSDKHNKHRIWAFDLTQDRKFRRMLLPKGLYADDYNIIKLSAGDCLLLARLPTEDAAHDQCIIDVWAMREYGVGDSWTKLYNLKFSDHPYMKQWSHAYHTVFVTETSTVFPIFVGLWPRFHERVLVKILHKGGECSFHKVKDFNYHLEYQESLLGIDDYISHS